ncbi:MAG: helix-turn-helix transcriptional regulator [Planctomycetota bacterium]|nr:helix-turn-helix transcriptional regulator [Planctomycetota bacterium]MSR39684.1 XRE family transcriptional regulator [Planctomycetota bacterium]
MSEPVLDPEQKLFQNLAARLRELRARFAMTQDQVAKVLGVHESAVSRWEKAARFPSGIDLVKLGDLFRVSVDYLLARECQFSVPGNALVDMVLLGKLDSATSTDEFDGLIAAASADQAVWLLVPDGAVLMPVAEAIRRTRRVTDKHRMSRFADRLFRPRG